MRSQALRRKSTRKVVMPEAFLIELEQNRIKNAGLEWRISPEQPEPMPYWPEKKEEKASEGLIIIEL